MALADAAYFGLLAWNLFLVSFLVFLNGFFVAAEFAIVKVRETQLTGLKGPRPAAARHITSHLDAYLSACQLGITIASLGLGWIGEPAIAHLLVEPLMGRFVTSASAVRGISFAIAFFIIMILHIVVGELAPKSIAIRRSRQTALWTAIPLRAFRKVFAPMIWLMNGAANLLLRFIGIHPLSAGEGAHSVDELRILLARAQTKERTHQQSAEVASRVFGLLELEVRDIMVPRDRMVTLDLRRSFEENYRVVEGSSFQRYPLADGGPDSILGFVHLRDLVAAAKKDPPPRLQDIMREVHVAHTHQPASRALFDMLEKRRPMTIVVNEFGTTVGLLTMEDIFEELVGDIPSEFSRLDSRLRVLSPGHYIVDASIPLHELQVVLREPVEERGAATLAGMLNNHLGRIPAKGESVSIGHYHYWIKEADRKRAILVEIVRAADPADLGPPPAPTVSGDTPS